VTNQADAKDWTRSKAVLIGTSRYTELPQVPAARNSLRRMRALLASPSCGWPKDRIVEFADLRRPGNLPDVLARHFAEASDIALFYFVGHGLLDSRDQLCLAMSETSPERHRRPTTSLTFEAVRHALQESDAERKIVILDCCFAGRAVTAHGTMSGPESVTDLVRGTGGYLLVAAREFETAWFEEDSDTGQPYTYFTKHFTHIVENGIPGEGPGLTLDAIFRRLRRDIAADSRQTPDKISRDTMNDFVFARNVAYLQPSTLSAAAGAAPLPPPARTGPRWWPIGGMVAVLIAGLTAVPLLGRLTAGSPGPGPSPHGSPTPAVPRDYAVIYPSASATGGLTQPVLRDSHGNSLVLPAGGVVEHAVKTPAGWLVVRAGTDSAGPTQDILWWPTGSQQPKVVASGAHDRAWINGPGSSILVDERGKGPNRGTPRQTGPVMIEQTATGLRHPYTLQGSVDIVDWARNRVVLSVPAADDNNGSDRRFDYWTPNAPYELTPSDTSAAGEYLGTIGTTSDVLNYTTSSLSNCIYELDVDQKFTVVGHQCDIPAINLKTERGYWTAISPDGTYIALPGANNDVTFARVDELLAGASTTIPLLDIPGPARELEWRDDTTADLLLTGDPRVWRCSMTGGQCVALPTSASPSGPFDLISELS
jgi:hypothetical protein